LVCDVMYSCRNLPTFRTNVLPPYSSSIIKTSKIRLSTPSVVRRLAVILQFALKFSIQKGGNLAYFNCITFLSFLDVRENLRTFSIPTEAIAASNSLNPSRFWFRLRPSWDLWKFGWCTALVTCLAYYSSLRTEVTCLFESSANFYKDCKLSWMLVLIMFNPVRIKASNVDIYVAQTCH
jgi:hypothetical protein